MVEVQAEALLIVDCHCHLKVHQRQRDKDVLIAPPKLEELLERYVDQMQDPVDSRVTLGRRKEFGRRPE
jgi:guanylate kinase